MRVHSFCPSENGKKPQKQFLDGSFCSHTMDRENWTTQNSRYQQLHYVRDTKQHQTQEKNEDKCLINPAFLEV